MVDVRDMLSSSPSSPGDRATEYVRLYPRPPSVLSGDGLRASTRRWM